MNVRTISQLPLATDVSADCLFEMSKPSDNGLFTSNKLKYDTLKNRLQEESKSFLKKTYNITENMNFDDINRTLEYFKKLINIQYSSQKAIFYRTPSVGANDLATENYVTEHIKSDNASVITSKSRKLYNISEITFNQNNYTTSQEYEIEQGYTGNLVLYGWLCDDGSAIHPAMCWVALEGYLNNSWITLQLQPWILGTYRSQLQYISFNLPISTASNSMKIRIKCGFNLAESSTGSQNVGDSYADSITNKFTGYILGI